MSRYQEALVVGSAGSSQRPVVHLMRSCAGCGVSVVIDNFGATLYTAQGVVCSEACAQTVESSRATQ